MEPERRTTLWERVTTAVALRLGGDRERGDVPGWVLVTLMTAGLVTALWLIAEPALRGVFDEAISNVTP